MSTQGLLKCRFCTYRVSRWRGSKVSGVRKLQLHVRNSHYDEYIAVQQQVWRATISLDDDEGCDELAYYDGIG